ncbi:MAG TPA: hypothetical protein PLX09_13175, partial [Xanthomonadaceae bacterium]|nr:hypothetical protein [Xanthomonadaceae bacterium]
GMVVAWYTYTPDGNYYWIVGSGTLTDNVASFDLSTTAGGTFPPSAQPDGITYLPWGSLTISFTDCNHALAEWTPLESVDLEAGSMPLTRLTKPQGVSCP